MESANLQPLGVGGVMNITTTGRLIIIGNSNESASLKRARTGEKSAGLAKGRQVNEIRGRIVNVEGYNKLRFQLPHPVLFIVFIRLKRDKSDRSACDCALVTTADDRHR